MRELLKELRQFMESRHPRWAWQRLTVSPGVLLNKLQAAVRYGLSPNGLAELEECCRHAESGPFREQIRACYTLGGGDSIDDGRLHRNVVGLMRTAQTVVAARHLLMGGTLPELLAHSAMAAAQCLHLGKQPDVEPKWPAYHLGDLDELTVIEQVYGVLAEGGWEVSVARLWALYWLTGGFRQRTEVLPQKRLEVPFAAWVENQQSGRLAWLHLYRLGETGPLVEHPGNAFRPLGMDWMKVIKGVWERSSRPAVCWNVRLHSLEQSHPLAFRGNSASGAASLAFAVLPRFDQTATPPAEVARQSLAYDLRCLIIARVHNDGTLETVTREKEKINAAFHEGQCRLALVAQGKDGIPGTQLKPEDIDAFGQQGIQVETAQNLVDALDRLNGEVERMLRRVTRNGINDYPSPGVLTGDRAFPEGYELVRRLGRGGFGEVWEARKRSGFSVALKFVPLQGRAGAIEAGALELLKHIRHPNLLATFDAWQSNEFLIIEMELADGTLQDRLHECSAPGFPGIPRNELLEYMQEAAKGIDYLNTARHGVLY